MKDTHESALLVSQARWRINEATCVSAQDASIREAPPPGQGGGRPRLDGGRVDPRGSGATPGLAPARGLASPRPTGGGRGKRKRRPPGARGSPNESIHPRVAYRLPANSRPNRTPAPPRERAGAGRRGGRTGTVPSPLGPLHPLPHAGEPEPGSAGPKPRRPSRGGRAAVGREGSWLVTGLGCPQARSARAGRACPRGGRPRTHITGRGPGPHPGSPGAEWRGAGRCRPTRSLPAKRGSPWRRQLADRLLAPAPGPALVGGRLAAGLTGTGRSHEAPPPAAGEERDPRARRSWTPARGRLLPLESAGF